MQALRIASFLSRPTLLTLETLILICSYLTNSGRLLDAWALLGTGIRLAQGIGRAYSSRQGLKLKLKMEQSTEILASLIQQHPRKP